jgi:hypothetical protein
MMAKQETQFNKFGTSRYEEMCDFWREGGGGNEDAVLIE